MSGTHKTSASVLQEAFDHLAQSVEHLQAAVERYTKTRAQRQDKEEAFVLLQEDRARLALELEESLLTQARLLYTQEELEQHLGQAQTILQLLRAQDEKQE